MILFAFKEMSFGGGAEKNMIDVALHLAKRRRVGFFYSGGYVDPRMAAAGPLFQMPGRGRFWAAPLDLLYLAWVVVRHRVVLLHAHHRYPAFLAAPLRKLLRFKLVTTVHNRFPNRARASVWGDRAIAVSHDIAQWMRDECGTPDAMVRVIHNGIESPPVFTAAEIAAFRYSVGVPDGVVVLCAVGRLSAQKNFSLLLQALRAMPHRRWLLLLVGEGEEHAKLKSLTDELGLSDVVRFLGRRTDVPLVMQASDLLVMSSAWEGFPYVVVEALANRLPIVATDVGGVREGVIAGETGLLVRPGDEKGLTTAVAQMIASSDQRAAMGATGRSLFEASFVAEAMFRAIDEEFDKVGV